MKRISEAINFITKAFDGQVRKCEGHPAVLHSLEACVIAQTLTNDEDVVIATLLHDAIEDAGISAKQIDEMFGSRVLDLVLSETENKRVFMDPSESWKIRKEESIEVLKQATDIGVKILFLSDKLSNIRSFYNTQQRLGDKMWELFNQKDKRQHEWYFRSIVENTKELENTLAYKEFTALVDKVFKGE